METKYPLLKFAQPIDCMDDIPLIISKGIHDTVKDYLYRCEKMDELIASQKPGQNAWSRKEILGHLIDSAANNHQRFVRIQYENSAESISYEQNAWVRIQQHALQPWKDLILFWKVYNLHLKHFVRSLPVECMHTPCRIGKTEPIPFGHVVIDYLGHMQHHLRQIEQ